LTVSRHCPQVLLRKGGIREPTFTPKAQQFLLFPTAFHSEAQLLKSGIAERYKQVCNGDPDVESCDNLILLLSRLAAVCGAAGGAACACSQPLSAEFACIIVQHKQKHDTCCCTAG
jgi:hypothetical protein